MLPDTETTFTRTFGETECTMKLLEDYTIEVHVKGAKEPLKFLSGGDFKYLADKYEKDRKSEDPDVQASLFETSSRLRAAIADRIGLVSEKLAREFGVPKDLTLN